MYNLTSALIISSVTGILFYGFNTLRFRHHICRFTSINNLNASSPYPASYNLYIIFYFAVQSCLSLTIYQTYMFNYNVLFETMHAFSDF